MSRGTLRPSTPGQRSPPLNDHPADPDEPADPNAAADAPALEPLRLVRERAPWRHGDLALLSLCLTPAARLDLGSIGEATVTHAMLALEGTQAEQQRRSVARRLGGCEAADLESGRSWALSPNKHPDFLVVCDGACDCGCRLGDLKGSPATADAWALCCDQHGSAAQSIRYPRLCWALPELRPRLHAEGPVWVSPAGSAPAGWRGVQPAELTAAYPAQTDAGLLLLRVFNAQWSTPVAGDDDRTLFGVTLEEVRQAQAGREAHRAWCRARTLSGRRWEDLHDRVLAAGRELHLEDRRLRTCWEDAFLDSQAVGVGVRWRWMAKPRIYVQAGSPSPRTWRSVGELPLTRGGQAPLFELVEGVDLVEAIMGLAA